jgi:hypothetical protein
MKVQWLGVGIDILVGGFFALASAWAFQFILLIPFWIGVLTGLLLYVILRALSWLGEKGDLD